MNTRALFAFAAAPALLALAACSGTPSATLPAPNLETCPINFERIEGLSDVPVDVQTEGVTSADAINAWKQIVCFQAGDYQFSYQGGKTLTVDEAEERVGNLMSDSATDIFTTQYEILLDEVETLTEPELSATARSAQAFVWVTPQDSEPAGIGVFRPGLPGALTITGTAEAPVVTVTTNSSIHAPTTTNDKRTLNWDITYTMTGNPNSPDPRYVWTVDTWEGALTEGTLS